MKKVIFIISLCVLALVSCTTQYETDFDFCLDRDEFRFAADSGQSYFRIYGTGKWTAIFEQEVDWVFIDKTSGFGETQVNVKHKKNEGLSRGINLFIDHEDGTRHTVYLSQKSGLSSDKPAYSLSVETLKLLSLNMNATVKAVSNVSAEAVDSATVKVHYTGEDTTWLSGVIVTPEEVALNIGENKSGADRNARIEISFNGAKWADPYTVFLNVIQGHLGPQVTLANSYNLDPLGTKPLEITLQTNWDTSLYSYDISDFSISDESFIRSVEYVDSTNTIKLLPQMNKSKNSKNTTLTWYAKDKSGSIISTAVATLTQNVSPIQLDSDPINLTEGGKFANCYILPEHGKTYYCLEPKMVSGVLPAEDITDAKLLWQTSEDILAFVAYSATENLVYIYKPEGVKGNAVVALTSADGTVRWSFHFWATDEPVLDCTVKGVTFMDRNLGALATTAPVNGESDAAGTHYQWGRKDPFPTAQSLKTANGVLMDVYPAGAITKKTKENGVSVQNGVSLAISIENPATYYWGTDNKGKQDWAETQSDGYWNTIEKTDYDPCPYGYVVPDKAQLESLIKSITSKSSYGSTITCDGGETNYLCWGGWFRRKLHDTAEFAHTGQYPHYWSTTTGVGKEGEEEYNGSYATENTTTIVIKPRRWGGNVRCVKANNQ